MLIRPLVILCALAMGAGCSEPKPATSVPGATQTVKTSAALVVSAPSASATALTVADAGVPTDAGTLNGDAGAADAGASDAGAGNRYAGKTVLHIGDSMVGGQAGLTRALEAKFKAAGAKKFVSDTIVSSGISSFAQQPRFKQALLRHKPDIVIITLGANDVFVPHPETLTPHVQSIVKKAGAHECYWVSPATWKKDSGIVDILKDNVAPCKFFDARNIDIPRGGDHIHPTDKGGAQWADKVWEAWFQ
jgi:lysophospholipase L1-like esterase